MERGRERLSCIQLQTGDRLLYKPSVGSTARRQTLWEYTSVGQRGAADEKTQDSINGSGGAKPGLRAS